MTYERTTTMPITVSNITRAARKMLPTYPVFFAVIGLSYLITPSKTLLATPGLRGANYFMPLHVWGSLFLAIAAAQLAVLIFYRDRRGARGGYELTLAIGGISMVIWALVMIGAAIFFHGTWSGWVWPAFVARACEASATSLVNKER